MRNFAGTFISQSVFVLSVKRSWCLFPQIEVEEHKLHNYDITYEYCKNTVIVDVGRDLQLQGGALICVNYRK